MDATVSLVQLRTFFKLDKLWDDMTGTEGHRCTTSLWHGYQWAGPSPIQKELCFSILEHNHLHLNHLRCLLTWNLMDPTHWNRISAVELRNLPFNSSQGESSACYTWELFSQGGLADMILEQALGDLDCHISSSTNSISCNANSVSYLSLYCHYCLQKEHSIVCRVKVNQQLLKSHNVQLSISSSLIWLFWTRWF